jgi:VanZ family protein
MNHRRFLVDVLPVLLWLAFIFSMSTGAGASTHTNSFVDAFLARYFPSWFHRLTPPECDAIHYYIRKSAHVFEYAVLGGLMLRALRRNKAHVRRAFAVAWLLSTCYAATDEFHQSFVPGRTPKVTDVMLDSAGAAFGIGLMMLLARRPLVRRTQSQV